MLKMLIVVTKGKLGRRLHALSKGASSLLKAEALGVDVMDAGKIKGFYVKDYPDPKISKMTPEELGAFIEAEKERSEKMTDWSEAWAEIVEYR